PELPQRLAGGLVEREELAAQLAGEDEATAGRHHPCGARKIGERNLPLLLAADRVDRDKVTKHVARLESNLPADGAGRVRAKSHRLAGRRRELLDARQVPGARVDQAG